MGDCFSAELLIRAKSHWMDSLTLVEVNKMTPGEKQSYEARSQIGDIIVVRSDGWLWGKEECLPNYVVVKVPSITEAQAKQYEQSLIDNTDPQHPKLIRVRKYALPKVDISAIKTNSVTFTKTAITNKLITKTGLASEISAPINSPIGYLWRKVSPYLTIVKKFWLDNAYAATQLKKTVMPSGGDYTALETCMNANEQNLVTADKYFDVEIDGTWSSADTTAVTIHNYTTDATRYINIYTTAAARHKGKVTGTINEYRLDLSASTNVDAINISGYLMNVRIVGLVIEVTSAGTGDCVHINQLWGGVIKITNSIMFSDALSASLSCGIYSFSTDTPILCYNNIIYSLYYGCLVQTNAATTIDVFNSTISGCYFGMNTIPALVKNSAVFNNADDYAGTITVTYSASDDAQAGTGNIDWTAEATDWAANFVDYANGDFHLKSTAPNLIDAGTDLSGTFTDDIDGVTRSGTWDIGADEYVAPAAGGIALCIINFI